MLDLLRIFQKKKTFLLSNNLLIILADGRQLYPLLQ